MAAKRRIRKTRRAWALALAVAWAPPIWAQRVELFRRGDVNTDGFVDIADVASLAHSFDPARGPRPCDSAADVNDDGNVDPADVAHLLRGFFSGGLEIPAPGPGACGPDPTPDTLSCGAYLAPCTAPAPLVVLPEFRFEIAAPGFVEGVPGDDVDLPVEVHVENALEFQAWSLAVQTSCPVVATSSEGTIADVARLVGFYQETIVADGGRHGVLVAAAFSQPDFVLEPGRYRLLELSLRSMLPESGCAECRVAFADDLRDDGRPLGNRVVVEGASLRPETTGATVLACAASRPIDVGMPANATVVSGGPEARFRTDPFPAADVGRVLLIELEDPDVLDANALYARWGLPALPAAFDGAADARRSPSHRLVLPFVQARSLHLLARGTIFGGDSNDLAVVARLVDVAAGDVFPRSAATGHPVTALIRGGGFSDQTTFILDHEVQGVSVQGTVRRMLGPARAEVVFDLGGAPPGSYSLTTTNVGAQDVFAGAFDVLPEGPGPALEVGLTTIARHRRGRAGRLTLRYRNGGRTELAAPLLKVIAPEGTELRLDGEVGSQARELLALAGNPEGIQDVLSPGASGELAVLFRTSSETPLGPVDFEVRVLPPGSDAAVEWASQPAPPGVPDAVWTSLRPKLANDLGATWGAYQKSIASLGARLAARGGVASSVTGSFRFAARTALGRANAAIVGQLRDSDGIPLTGERVVALSAGQPEASSATDFEGRYAIDWLAPGATYQLTVPGYSVGKVERALGGNGDVLGADLTGTPAANAVAPACAGCDESDLPGGPLVPPSELMEKVAAIELSVIAARDPNSKEGPAGPGEGSLLGRDREIEYTVFFENVASADDPDAAPAAEVVITDVIDPDLEPTTLRFRSASFGDRFIHLDQLGGYDLYGGYSSLTNEERFEIREEIPITTDAGDFVVRIDAVVNFLASVIAWRFRTLDPDTLLPPEDPDAGFLPPKDEEMPGANEGSVSFTIEPKKDVEEGTEIENSAEIVFDGEVAIMTNTAMGTVLFEPEAPVGPMPPSGGGDPVGTRPHLSWSPQPRVETYDLYLWRDDFERPLVPTAAGLTESGYQPAAPLAPGVVYRWQVVAVNPMGQAAGPEWTFATAIPFVRGDANADGRIDLSDPIAILLFLFGDGVDPTCREATDVNHDGKAPDLADPVFLLNWLFAGGDDPPAPAPAAPGVHSQGDCGIAAEPGDCESFGPCS